MRKLLLTFALALLATPAFAQTVPPSNILGPADGVKVDWPTPTVNPDGLNAPESFAIDATSITQTGVVVRSWTAPLTARTMTLTPAMIPAGGFTLTVHPVNAAGKAGASNVLGPFGKREAPAPLTGVAASKVGGLQ